MPPFVAQRKRPRCAPFTFFPPEVPRFHFGAGKRKLLESEERKGEVVEKRDELNLVLENGAHALVFARMRESPYAHASSIYRPAACAKMQA
ncbi:hypothetical protein POVWA1_006440 [Plasmodium ovale wallikeri]|uniref:Uncharacterized protein n=1 Tax=Plasmodium ovale wallikeri TaxID=864142 RepID=A0A1A8YIC5_PLAOA|nr:hypothetical protein POVWA1_006440 [Plasmodium ovale wallikeri]